MRRLQIVVAVGVLFLTLVPPLFADWMDDMCRKPGACWQVGPLSPTTAQMYALDAELRGIIANFRSTAEKYRKVGEEAVTPLNAVRRCNEFFRLNPFRDMVEVQEQARRVIAIVQAAQTLVEEGGVAPEGIREAIDGDLPGVMHRVLGSIQKLQSVCSIVAR